MNEIRHFFGAFVDVVVKVVDYDLTVRECANGHAAKLAFCPTCGQPVQERLIRQQRYVTDHYELLDDDLAETLAVITPPALFGKGHIVLRANQGSDTVWMEVDRSTSGDQIRPFPSDAEQNAMMAALLALPAVRELQAHSQVASLTAMAGYCEDSDY